MTSPEILGQLNGLHEMMRGVPASMPTADANHCLLPKTGSLAWIMGRSVFRETYWLREILAEDRLTWFLLQRLFLELQSSGTSG